MSRRERSQQLRRTIVGLFGEQAKVATQQMWSFDANDWRQTLPWMHSSGMALYLLIRMRELQIEHLLPPDVHASLEQNHADNKCRVAWLLTEMAEIASIFNAAKIPFAFIKGLTLLPKAVPDPSVRCQTDIDIVASRACASSIRKVFEARGYILYADGNGTDEFRTLSSSIVTQAEMYRVRPQRAIEVHWVVGETESQRGSIWRGQLERAKMRRINEVPLPCLSEQDQLLNQVLHLFGHLRGEHTRASWILELARHLKARGPEEAFWKSFNDLIRDVPGASVACGGTLALIEEIFGFEPPQQIASLKRELAYPVQRWVEAYAMRIATSDAPGNKLYLLLETALANGKSLRTLHRSRLLPQRLPPMVMHRCRAEPWPRTLKRYVVQLWLIFYRLVFHLRTLVEFAVERKHWKGC